MGRRWYSIRETCEYFGLRSPKTLYLLVGKGKLPPGAVLKIGRQIRLNIEAIEKGAAIKGLR
jgi:hypothetical protein